MAFLTELWLPITATAGLLFVLSSLAWTILPHHQGDFKELPDLDAWERFKAHHNLTPGIYMFPFAEDHKDMSTPEFKQRYQTGPWGLINVWPNRPNMPRNMLVTLIYFAIVAVGIAYITAQARPLGASFAPVFQVATTAAALAFIGSGFLNGVWFGKPIRWLITDTIDNAAYTLAAGLTFALLWPAA